MSATARAKREAVAAAIAAAVPEGWTVYPSPPDVISTPCVVVGPRPPYREMTTFQSETVGLQVSIFFQMVAGQLALDVLDETVDLIRPALETVEECAVLRVNDLGIVTTDKPGVEYFAGSIDITVT